jgi:hypothetical protein
MSEPRVEKVDDDRFLFIHDCFDSQRVDGQVVQVPDPQSKRYLPLGEGGWVWTSDGQSILPSIHCQRCGAHGYWTNGEWVKTP